MRLPLRMALSHQVGAAAVDELLELRPGNDALIGGPPSLVVRVGDRAWHPTAWRDGFR